MKNSPTSAARVCYYRSTLFTSSDALQSYSVTFFPIQQSFGPSNQFHSLVFGFDPSVGDFA